MSEKKKFIKLNTNDKYLSLGNFFRVIKEEAIDPKAFWQSDLFSIIFNTDNIADSTVNNYCTGLRAINSKYKNYFNQIKNNYQKDSNALIPIIVKILELIDYKNENINSIKQINQNKQLKHICTRLYSISKNDSDVSINLSNLLYKNLNENNLYSFITEVLFYVILEKKQPIYISNSLNDIIEKNIYDTNISVENIEEFIKIQLNSGIWSIRGINELAKKDNPFACFEMASLEFYGIINGTPRYETAYEYYKIAASHNHPVANWAIGYLYYNGYIGCKSKHDLFLSFKFFNKSRKLNCSNAFNSLGLLILNGNIPHIAKNKAKAIEFFQKAAFMGNVYAYNNLGKIFETEKKLKNAYDCYIYSANLGDSWAANKIGEFYRIGKFVNKDLKKAFDYYTLSSQCPIFTLCPWSKYNLAKYYYENGNLEIGIRKDIKTAINLLDEISDSLVEALEELILIYYNLYVNDVTSDKYLKKLNYYISKLEKNPNFNSALCSKINKNLKALHSKKTHIQLPK